MKKQLNHLLIYAAIDNLEREGKSVNLTNLAKETGYTYHELYFSEFKHLAKKKAFLVKPTTQPSIFPPELKPIRKRKAEPINLHFIMGENEFIFNFGRPDKDGIDNAIEDLEFIAKQAVKKLQRLKGKSEE